MSPATSTQIQAALTHVGVAASDADCLAARYDGADPDEFLVGLEWLATLYDLDQIPNAPLPVCEPWAATAAQLQQVQPGDFRQVFMQSIAHEEPPVQAAITNAMIARAQVLHAQAGTAAKKPGQRASPSVTSVDLLNVLRSEGWVFRTNQADDTLEVNGKPITDGQRAMIRERLRDLGYGRWLAAAEDSMLAEGERNSYHPVRDYLSSLVWRGDPQISWLASAFDDKEGKFPLYLRKWLIGAVRRAMTGRHHRVLVLESKQNMGKSQFAKWLCAVPGYFDDSSIYPDDKDCAAKALRTWIWEVSELGATTRRQDIESLKAFLSREIFRFRPAYGHFEVNKPGLASFIGTANDSSGLFGDPTGSRRFMTCNVLSINWRWYVANCDVNQIWAEAYTAWQDGESPDLDADEAAKAEEINAAYQFVDPVELLFMRMYPNADPDNKTVWTSTAEILVTLQSAGLGTNARANAMALAATLKRLGYEKGKPSNQNGYWGVR